MCFNCVLAEAEYTKSAGPIEEKYAPRFKVLSDKYRKMRNKISAERSAELKPILDKYREARNNCQGNSNNCRGNRR